MGGDDDLDNIVVPSSSAEENNFVNQKPTIRNSQKKKRKRDEAEDMEWVPSQNLTGAAKKIWSEKDEIRLLKVLKKESDKSDMIKLYNDVKPYLDAEFSIAQVRRKVSRLKSKFINTSEDALPASSHAAKIRKLCKEIWSKSEPVAVDPHMTRKEFQERYPRIDASINDLPPYDTMTDEVKTVVISCMIRISPKKLDEIEDEWTNYLSEEVEQNIRRLQLSNKQSMLLQKGTVAYNQTHRI
ncbi:hypothetical protein L2E82_24329 [Cichorium intybus]|uniref:Uncharacterized protein n=1 Tax=Cichorium intybus TaxID=13427 RepID=A0ACB9E1M1_CICIN|nr:hypothetical protein L2E82_24329 [Cichorium intybus]